MAVTNPGLLLGYLTAALASAALRIRRPSVSGALGLQYFFVLLAIPQFPFAAIAGIAAAAALLETLVFHRPFRWRVLATEVVVAAGAASLASGVYALLADGNSPLPLVVASGALFLATSAGRAQSLSVWRRQHAWMFPHYVAGGGVAGLLSMTGGRTGWEAALVIVPAVYWMLHSYRYYLDELHLEQQQARELARVHFRTIEALTLAIEGHDPSKHGNLRRVSVYATEIGRAMGLPESEVHALQAAAMLHDIGKVAVPEHIVTKPGQLTDAEFDRLKIHPVAGAEILEQVHFPYPVAPVVRAHHEKWDGTGYPEGLQGEAIPLTARILAAVDCLDALVSDRYHRRALTLEQAVEYLNSESGKSFDPAVVAIVTTHYAELEAKVRQAEEGPQSPVLLRIAAARQEEQQFFQLARDLGNSLSLDKTLDVCAGHLRKMCPHDGLMIFLRLERNLEIVHAAGMGPEAMSSSQVLAKQVAEQRAPVRHSAQDQSVVAVPIPGVKDLIGVLTLHSGSKDTFQAEHVRLLTAVAARVSAAIENSLKYSQAEQSATTDVLTGLANTRSLFAHLDGELARARRNHDTVTVLVCDLDRFKQLNDLHGHMEGNHALRAVGQTLKKQCREYDFVARMGGDEFVIVLPTYPASSAVAKIEQLRQSVTASGVSEGRVVSLSISIGHASFPEDGEDAEALLAVADRRMYRMKQQTAARSAVTTASELRTLGERLGPRETIQ